MLHSLALSLHKAQQHSLNVLSESIHPTRPQPSTLEEGYASLFDRLPETGVGIETTTDHLLRKIAPGLSGCSLSPSYYGFVTGGVTHAARVAEHIVATYDQNVQVHLPDETIATAVENKALIFLLDLFNFDPDFWPGRTFTTGATASNVLGLACGREYIVNKTIMRHREQQGLPMDKVLDSVGEIGLLAACRTAGIEKIQILTTMPHSSLGKAASIIGLGRSCVVDVSKAEASLAFDLSKLKSELALENTVSIVAVSCAEVNTGMFATHSYEELQTIRSLCDEYGAWIHVDAAFGIFARILDGLPEFEKVCHGTEGLELADSITGDAHKLLNVPYDCGFFFCRHQDLARQVFQNANAAYLNSATTGPGTIPSPLNIGLENSRRFRGLPVYATLIAYGRNGYKEMLERQIRFARAVAAYIHEHPAYELLPESLDCRDRIDQDIFIVVLFKAKNASLNMDLVRRINSSGKMYVSGTKWHGQPASRIAVANWQVDPTRDLELVKTIVEAVLRD